MTFLSLAMAFLSLVALETVLGIDNIVFVGILSDRLESGQRPRARMLGLVGAIFTRCILLLAISWLVGLTSPLFVVFGHAVSLKDLILLAGGLFLIYKATMEIHHLMENGQEVASNPSGKVASFWGTIGTIMIMDVVFSLDSVITAVAMVNQVSLMIAAIIVAMLIMIMSVNKISDFISLHPTVKTLALSFLLMIGFTLIVGAIGFEIPKAFIYVAMGFSIFVETLNIKMHARHKNK